MLAVDLTTALGSSLLAFLLGVCIGVSLGYVIWADRMQKRRGRNDRIK